MAIPVDSVALRCIGVLLLLAFYAIYLGKLLAQKRRGIQTDQIAKGRQKDKIYYTELVMKLATYSVVAVEAASILLAPPRLPLGVRLAGAVLALAGDVLFGAAVYTMRDSWRAGLARGDRTELVTAGIYRFSRNPAFLAFDLVYLGLLLMFFNGALLAFSLFAALMLHLQILQEEAYLPTVFGEDYLRYKQTVCRYFGRRRVR